MIPLIFRNLFIGWLGIGLALCAVPSQAQDSSRTATVVPDSTLDAGKIHRFFFGSDYRALWTTPIQAEVLNLRTEAGGLSPVGTGKGVQSLGLRFVGADGRPYSFRPMKKSLLDLMPEQLHETFAGDLLDDQVSSALPTAAPVVPVLLDAVGVLHSDPRIVVIPDDPLLGEYRAHFAGQLGTIEEWPNEGPDGTPGFAGATEIVSTEELREILQADPHERVDARTFLAARLVDLLIGDWDRHRNQWRWANVGDGSPPAWVPIPEDRDQAFAKYDGLMLDLAQGAPQLTEFGPKYSSILGMTWNGRRVDRQFLVGLDRADWDSVTTFVQSSVTDSVIHEAVKRLPSAHYEIAGMELESDLRTRRELLPEITDDYYRHLAGEVDIQATDWSEVVEVARHSDGSIDVSIGTRSDGEETTTPYYDRRFDPEDTEEIRIYLNGGDDLVTVTGHGNTKIELRVISGEGQDVVINDSGRRGVKVYDTRQEGGVAVEGGVVDRREYMAPEPDRWAPHEQDWGNRRVWMGRFDIGGDIGPFLGARVVRKTYGFRKDRYAWQLSARLGYSFMLNAFTLGLDLSRRSENSKKIGNLNLLLSGIESINFYGFGNETQLPANDSAADVDRRVARLTPSLKLALSRDWTFSLGVPFQYSKTKDDPGTIMGTTNPYGTSDFWQAGLRVGLVHDSRNVPAWPTSGVLLDLEGAFYPEVLDVEDGSFRSLEGFASGVYSVFRYLALAGRIGAKGVWGNYPYWEAAYIGGVETVRGYQAQRFAGDGAVFAGLEARVPVSNAVGEFGLFGLLDTGRVFVDGESSDRWHTGYGGGVYLTPLFRQFTMSFSVADSREDTIFHFKIDTGF